MKILWVKTDYLHPTNRGGQIRTLEMLKCLHRRHEVHFLTLDDGAQPEGPARAGEYSRFHYAVPHHPPDKRSPAFALQLLTGLFSRLPVAVFRWQSQALRQRIVDLDQLHHFDVIVCDFLFPAPSLPDLPRAVLFQHNVEALIWKRHATHGRTPIHRWYFGQQAAKMVAYEQEVSRTVRHVIAVSEEDARMMERDYGLKHVDSVPTGVDTAFFQPPAKPAEHRAELVFLGSMDWLPNIDGAEWLVAEVMPLLWKRFPECRLALVGRKPSPAVEALAVNEPRIIVTGTVPDVRPWLHGGRVSIVPLRIGGGTRLKIYEAMAAGIPVVSTTIGAEGLSTTHGENILLADEPAAFAAACCKLMAAQAERQRLAANALAMVRDFYSWEAVTTRFEKFLRK